jgi:opacity protein-like surface antigen
MSAAAARAAQAKGKAMTSQELAAAALALRPAQFYDRRAFAKQSHHGYDTRERDIKIVTGACLHQAGVDLGERVERYDTGGAHAFVTRMGKWIWLHDWDRWVCAANGWNNGTISIEVSGRYCGVEGKLSTFWRAKSGDMPQVVTPRAAQSSKSSLRIDRPRHHVQAILARGHGRAPRCQ